MKIFIPLSILAILSLISMFVFLGSKDYTSYDDYLQERIAKDPQNVSEHRDKFNLYDNFVEYNAYLDSATKDATFYFTDDDWRFRHVKVNRKINNKMIDKDLRCMLKEEGNHWDWNYNEHKTLTPWGSRPYYMNNCVLEKKPLSEVDKGLEDIYNVMVEFNNARESGNRLEMSIQRTQFLNLLSNHYLACMVLSNKYFTRESKYKTLEHGNGGLLCEAKLDIMFKTIIKPEESDDKVFVKRKFYYKKNN